MDFVCKLYGNTYAVHVTVALVGVRTLNLAFTGPPCQGGDTPYTKARRFLSTCERGHLGLRSIARVIIL